VLPNDNVSMSVGHLDHVLIVYSLMEQLVTKEDDRKKEEEHVAKALSKCNYGRICSRL